MLSARHCIGTDFQLVCTYGLIKTIVNGDPERISGQQVS